MKVMTILGTRPEIIRLAATIPVLDRFCEHVLVHTGQNYDDSLSDIFFREMGLRKPYSARTTVFSPILLALMIE